VKLKVFLSYCREDEAFIGRFRAELGGPVESWLDRQELRTGERFPQKIQDALESECDFFVVFLTRAALESTWVMRELQWALGREKELGQSVPFVLPALLEADAGVPEVIADRHHFDWFDHSAAGVSRAVHELSLELFALVARAFVLSKRSGPAAILAELDRDVRDFSQTAFGVVGAMSDSVNVIAHNADANAALARAVSKYGAIAEPIIPRMGTYVERVRQRWGVNLGEECRSLARFLEESVYRELFGLNAIIAQINELEASARDRPANNADVLALDRRKARTLKKVQRALDELSLRTGEFISKLRREL
jgi:hypothetical protein